MSAVPFDQDDANPTTVAHAAHRTGPVESFSVNSDTSHFGGIIPLSGG
jgi:hypothetical protein